ncbi:MAG: hypothetical protein KBD12_01745 [Candidatus Pacebacteria bacterium]|nr:hypothetical protein [Candidatus Paceibacterota bacterium]
MSVEKISFNNPNKDISRSSEKVKIFTDIKNLLSPFNLEKTADMASKVFASYKANLASKK